MTRRLAALVGCAAAEYRTPKQATQSILAVCHPHSSPIHNSRQARLRDTRLSGGSISRCKAKRLLERMLGLGADGPGHGPTVAVEHQEGDALYAGVVGEVRLIVDVDLADFQRPGVLCCDLFDHRRELPAGTTPGRPAVDQDGDG